MTLVTEIAKATLQQLSGVRAGTLPFVLAARLAQVQILHTRHVTCPAEGVHAVCDECGQIWPCPSYRYASGAEPKEEEGP